MQEVGYAHSSVDRQDNITCRERRGIRTSNVSEEGSIFRLSNALQMKRKSLISDEERVRDLQRKLYRKAKQEDKRKSQRKSRLCNQGAYKTLVERYRLVEITTWPKVAVPANA